jgi:hypothetical protein
MKKISAPPSVGANIHLIAILAIFSTIASIGAAIISSVKFLFTIPIAGAALFAIWSISTNTYEVFDCSDFLLIRKGKKDAKIPLSNISGIELFRGRQPFVRISLCSPCVFGSTIDFHDTAQVSGNPFLRLHESDDLITVRARLENTTVEALRAKQKKWEHPWPFYLLAAFVAWGFINSPSGPVESLNCTVLDATPTPKNRIKLTLRMSDSSVIEVTSKQTHPIGTTISCTRQKHRVTGGFSYECE